MEWGSDGFKVIVLVRKMCASYSSKFNIYLEKHEMLDNVQNYIDIYKLY